MTTPHFFRLFRRPIRASFATRSPSRDEEADAAIFEPIAAAIEQGLRAARSERVGLDRRLQAAQTTASAAIGYAADEYLTREAEDTAVLHKSEEELRRGHHRLRNLDRHIARLISLKAALTGDPPGPAAAAPSTILPGIPAARRPLQP